MKRNLAIVIIGLLILSYGQFAMPVTVHEESCAQGYTSVEDCDKGAIVNGEVENGERDPVRATGVVIAIAGAFLVLGD